MIRALFRWHRESILMKMCRGRVCTAFDGTYANYLMLENRTECVYSLVCVCIKRCFPHFNYNALILFIFLLLCLFFFFFLLLFFFFIEQIRWSLTSHVAMPLSMKVYDTQWQWRKTASKCEKTLTYVNLITFLCVHNKQWRFLLFQTTPRHVKVKIIDIGFVFFFFFGAALLSSTILHPILAKWIT